MLDTAAQLSCCAAIAMHVQHACSALWGSVCADSRCRLIYKHLPGAESDALKA